MNPNYPLRTATWDTANAPPRTYLTGEDLSNLPDGEGVNKAEVLLRKIRDEHHKTDGYTISPEMSEALDQMIAYLEGKDA